MSAMTSTLTLNAKMVLFVFSLALEFRTSYDFFLFLAICLFVSKRKFACVDTQGNGVHFQAGKNGSLIRNWLGAVLQWVKESKDADADTMKEQMEFFASHITPEAVLTHTSQVGQSPSRSCKSPHWNLDAVCQCADW